MKTLLAFPLVVVLGLIGIRWAELAAASQPEGAADDWLNCECTCVYQQEHP